MLTDWLVKYLLGGPAQVVWEFAQKFAKPLEFMNRTAAAIAARAGTATPVSNANATAV